MVNSEKEMLKAIAHYMHKVNYILNNTQSGASTGSAAGE